MSLPRIDLYLGTMYRDMHTEREYLLKRTFPEVRRMCEQRGVLFSVTEIKWSDKSAVADRQLSRLIDILSSPSAYYIGVKSKLTALSPASIDTAEIPSADLERSISTLLARGASWFDIERSLAERLLGKERTVLYASDEITANVSVGLQPLPPSQEQLSESVIDVIQLWISERWGDYVPTASTYHELYLQSRTINAMLGASKANELIAALDGTSQIVLFGNAGTGRSTTIGLALQALTTAGECVIPYVLEGSDVGEQAITRYLIAESGVTLPATGTNGQKNVSDLSLALATFKEGRCVIAFDGIEHLEYSSKYLAWMPSPLPTNVKLIVSTSAEDQAAFLVSKGWTMIAMEALSDDIIYGLIQHLSWTRNIHLTQQQVGLIACHPLAFHPQFLITLFDELGQFGWFKQLNTNVDEYLDEASIYHLFTSAKEGLNSDTTLPSSIILNARLLHYLNSHSIVELYQRVIERLEYDFGPPNITRILSYLALARRGLTIKAIEQLTALRPEAIRHVVNALGQNLLFSGDRILLANEYLGNAVKSRYFILPSVVKAVQSTFIHHLESNSEADDLEELTEQYIRVGQLDRLREMLLSPSNQSVLIRRLSYDTFHRYWKATSGEPIETAISNRVREYSTYEPVNARVDLLCNLANFLLFISKPAAAREMLEVAIAATDKDNSLIRERGRIFRLLGKTFFSLSNYREAEGSYRNAIDTFASIGSTTDPELLTAKQDLAYLLAEGAQYPQAEELYQELIFLIGELHGERSSQMASLNNAIALMRNAQGRYDEAIEIAKCAQEIFIDRWGKAYPELGWCYHIFATAYRQKGEHGVAAEWYVLAIERFKQIYGEEHAVPLRSMYGLSVLLQREYRFEEAEVHARNVVRLRAKLLGDAHADTAAAKVLLGSILKANHNYEESESLLTAGLSVFDVGANKEHPEVARTLHELGELYVLRNKIDLAFPILMRALDIRKKALGVNHPDTSSTHTLLSTLDQRAGGILKESHESQ